MRKYKNEEIICFLIVLSSLLIIYTAIVYAAGVPSYDSKDYFEFCQQNGYEDWGMRGKVDNIDIKNITFGHYCYNATEERKFYGNLTTLYWANEGK